MSAWEVYKKQRNLVTKLSKSNKRQNVVRDLKDKSIRNDIKGIWKTIKIASNISVKEDNLSKCDITPDEFNTHFSTVGSRGQAEIVPPDNVTFEDFLPPRSSETHFDEFSEVSASDIEAYIKTISGSKAVFDEIPINIFKAILPVIIKPLTHIVNLSLRTGEIPGYCKYAKVTPILKGGDVNDANNYRPISILPILAKIVEYFVNEQLTKYLDDNNILTSQQYGFRKQHSTTFLMFDLLDNIHESKSKSQTPAIIFLDVKKAFDSVDHDILIKKLIYYGIGGIVLKWFKNYLCGRHQCTKVGSNTSDFQHIPCGVPQGSILGPLLFSLYINDIVEACNLSIPFLYADDGALFFDSICRKTYLNIRIEMLTLVKWLGANHLSLSIGKTKIMIFDNEEESDEICITDDIFYQTVYKLYMNKFTAIIFLKEGNI